MTRIFHIATASDWAAAQATGRYTTSTRGRTLAEEGFLHASRGDQWEGVRQRFYADVTEPLVLLVIDTDLVGVPVVEESVLDSAETFPHIYGALDPSAVVQALPLDTDEERSAGSGATAPAATAPTPQAGPLEPTEPTESFSALFFREMFFNLALATIVLASVAVAALVGLNVDEEWGALAGTVVGFGVGLPLAIAMNRRRNSSAG